MGFGLQDKYFQTFLRLNSLQLTNPQSLFSSFAHNLELLGSVYDEMAKVKEEMDFRLNAFFENQFNDQVHKENKEFNETLKGFIKEAK